MAQILDQYGNPVKASALTREHGAPSLYSVRQPWHDSVATGLTPSALASLLTAANQGDNYSLLTLACEMEERDLHYAGVLNVRKLAVSGLPLSVESPSDDPADVARTDAVRALMRRPEVPDLLSDLLDGLGKGYSCVEIMWERTAERWTPARFIHRDPRFFVFDQNTGNTLRLIDDADPVNGVPLAPFKWIVHKPRLRTGMALRNGIARVVAWAHLFKSYTIKDWMAFCEVFGMPLRVGKYGPNATASEKTILLNAVANLGTDAAAIIPESMQIEFVEAAKASGGQALFEKLADWLDNQVTKYIRPGPRAAWATRRPRTKSATTSATRTPASWPGRWTATWCDPSST